MRLATENGEVVLYSELCDLKIDTSRRIYVRHHDKKGKPKQFKYIGRRLEHGYTQAEKERFLVNLQKKYEQRNGEKEESQKEEKGDK